MSAHPVGRIGPNAIIQTTAALRARIGDAAALSLVQRATGRSFDTMPDRMVDETEVIAMVHTLRERLEAPAFEAVLREAGARTAAYLIANRIPRIVQSLMRLLPATVALRVLLQGILRHSWTFAGTAQVRLTSDRHGPARLVMHHCPMCRGLSAPAPLCHYYAATLETLLTRLVTPRARVTEVACEAHGAQACEFALRVT